jgi:nucleoside-diphosphate-sugar epimerase
MKILILGGTGVISRAIVSQSLKQGHQVINFNRGTNVIGFEKDIQTIIGDRKNRDDFEKLRGVKCDAVIDMISFNPEDAKQTVEMFRDAAGQILFTSSIAAYARPYRTFPVREDAESMWKDPAFQYGYQKAQMENYLQAVMRENQIPVTIIRPSLTLGIGAKGIGVLRQNYNIVHRIKSGKPLVLFGDGTVLWSFTFAGDLARGYLLCCGNKNTYNEHFHITNDEVVMWKDFYDAIGELVGIRPRYAYIPSTVLNAANPKLFGHLDFEKKYCSVFDNSKFKKAAPSYKPVITLKEGMGEIIRWWKDSGCKVDMEKELLEDRMCTCCDAFQSDLARTMNP